MDFSTKNCFVNCEDLRNENDKSRTQGYYSNTIFNDF